MKLPVVSRPCRWEDPLTDYPPDWWDIVDADGSIVASDIGSAEVCDAICRAINSHTALMESLKEMRDACAACMRFANDRLLGLQLCEYIAKAQVEDGFGSRADELIGAVKEGIY